MGSNTTTSKSGDTAVHAMTGHKPRDVLIQILRGARAAPEYIEAAKHFRCDACSATANAPRTHPVAAPSHYAFNHELHVDVLEIYDFQGNRFSFLSVVDCGTTFHQVYLVRDGGGTPSSAKCLRKFVNH